MDEKNIIEERICAIALGRIFGYEPHLAVALTDSAGSASALFRMSKEKIDKLLGPYSKYGDKIGQESLEEAEREYAWLQENDYRYIARSEEHFPALLRDCADCPSGLYYRSSSPAEQIFGRKDYISVVGTRDISDYGREWCVRLVEAIAKSGGKPTIVSGLAMGTDITAHLTAMKHKAPTIAVMATGIDSIYPWRHMAYASAMEKAEACALVTDYPPRTAPVALNFLRRNRIIAGMARATILVESKVKGGGMMTARLASSYGREVFALPGRADDERSKGCNLLISRMTAEAVFDEAELLDTLQLNHVQEKKRVKAEDRVAEYYASSPDSEKLCQIVGYIRSHRGCGIEDISSWTELPYRVVSTLCSKLEEDGFINMDLLQHCTIKMAH